MYKYKSVKELQETGLFGYKKSTLSNYLKRPEFNPFRKELGTRQVRYLHNQELMKTWYSFVDKLIKGREQRTRTTYKPKESLKIKDKLNYKKSNVIGV